MPRTPSSSKKKTPRKAATQPMVDDATEGMQHLSVAACPDGYKPFSMRFHFPFLITIYKQGADEYCQIELFTAFVPQEYFLPETSHKGSALDIKCQVPDLFADENRVHRANAGVVNFTEDTHHAQGFKDICGCGKVENKYNQGYIIDDLQQIVLPF